MLQVEMKIIYIKVTKKNIFNGVDLATQYSWTKPDLKL